MPQLGQPIARKRGRRSGLPNNHQYDFVNRRSSPALSPCDSMIEESLGENARSFFSQETRQLGV